MIRRRSSEARLAYYEGYEAAIRACLRLLDEKSSDAAAAHIQRQLVQIEILIEQERTAAQ